MTWFTHLPTRLQRDPERGSVSLEAAVLIPGIVLLVMLMVFAGRVTAAKSGVANAAYAAARAASLERSPGSARSAATSAAAEVLGQQSLRCTPHTTAIDAAGFSARVGQASSVRAQVTCRVPVADLVLPGLPGSHDLSASAVSPIDRFRQREGS